nr:MAG TPA: hypothetical protein [Caudoviricetes sp.]DAS85772.1 MAG TPA: hypothetical protein [Caudoviricetes sp.]
MRSRSAGPENTHNPLCLRVFLGAFLMPATCGERR